MKKEQCIVCKKPLDHDEEWGVLGGEVKISFGYPSTLDGMEFSGNICAKCADRLHKSKVLKLTHNEFK